MKKTFLAILLSICMLVGLLPATVFASGEVEDSCLLTFNFPEELCDVYAYLNRNEDIKYVSGDSVPMNSSITYKITNIADGYRIKSVQMDGRDWTDPFVGGGYGALTKRISEDVTVTVELELIPDVLPSVSNVTLYLDERYTERAEGNVTIDQETRIWGKASYSDGVEYSSSYYGGIWEYSIDGVNWTKDYIWGNNRDDYWPGWSSRPADEYPTDMVTGSYYLRLCVEPKEFYTAGDPAYSNIIHINGDANKEQGDSNLHQLSAPTNLEWNKFYPWGETTAFDYNGAISWVTGDPDYDQTFEISLYKDNELQYTTEWDYEAGSGHTHWTDWDFSLGDVWWRGSGTYYYTVQALGDGETTRDSKIATSDTWTYTRNSSKIAEPTSLSWDGTTATWTEDDNAAGFVIDIYYSADDSAATSTDSLTRKSGQVWYYNESGDTNGTSDFAERYLTEEGYYYFTISTVSNDISQKWHSDEVLSPAYYYTTGSSDEDAGFTDVAAGAYYYDAVSWAVDKGITNGYGSESTFCPDIECTRGQVVTFLWRAAGSPEPTSLNNPFTDVASNAYYYKAVLWAVENGITAGYGSDTIFNPDGVCNRAQVATFMWRAAGKPSMAGVENKFTDVASGAYYYDAVLWAVENGITNGYGSDTIFNPDGNCTRGQIVTFLYRGI